MVVRATPRTRTPKPSETQSRSPSWAVGLRCGDCGASYPLDVRTACDRCFGPLSVAYSLATLRGTRPEKVMARRTPSLWRYTELLPPLSEEARERVPVGPSPLRRVPRLARALGLRELWVKEDYALPSGSFKDRPASVAVAYAWDHGYPAVGCASTGNLAAATARAARLVDLPAWVFVPEGLPEAKLLPVSIYGAGIVEVAGSYDDANRLAQVLAEEEKLGLVNINLRPYYTEGSKTLGLEVLEAFDWEAPDVLAVPLGSGALLSATYRALEQVRDLGWTRPGSEAFPRLLGSQPAGCSPIVDAFVRGSDRIEPVARPETIAESLAIGDPASGYEALRAIRETQGVADAPTEEEVRWALREAARQEGIWVEPAGGTVLASLKRQVEQGALDPSETAVAFLTGAGWKTPTIWNGRLNAPRLHVTPRQRSLELPSLLAPGPTDAPAEVNGTW